ncbi:hypothetical protein LEMLEM_LOCUS13810 [Lemmus lemmus]
MSAGTTASFYFCNEVPVGSGGSDVMPRVPSFPSQAAGPQGSIFSDGGLPGHLPAALSSLRALNAQGAEARSRAGLVGTKLAKQREECQQPFPFSGHRNCIFEQYRPPSSTVNSSHPYLGLQHRQLFLEHFRVENLKCQPGVAMPTQTPSGFQMKRSFSPRIVSFLFFIFGGSASPGRETRKATA